MSEERTTHENMVECYYNGTIIYVPVKMFVRVTMEMGLDERKYIRYKDGPRIYSMSLSNFKRVVENADAVHRVGGTALINVKELDEYLGFCRG